MSAVAGQTADSVVKDPLAFPKAVDLDKAVGSCPEIDVCIEGFPCNCLVDTGSQISTVTESFFRKLNDRDLADTGNYIRVVAANNLDVPYLGYTEVQMTIGGASLPAIGVFVVKDPVDSVGRQRKARVPGLLGSNVFAQLKSLARAR